MANDMQELLELTRENNKILRGMRRGARWSALFRTLWWMAILGAGGAAYYYYVAPYAEQAQQLYGSAQNILNSFRPGR